jgi:hypothetical protein
MATAASEKRLRCCTWQVVTCGLALVTAWGCGSSSYPVHGRVVWSDGSPAKELEGGFVGFESLVNDVNARGDIAADGTFSLSSLKKDDGLPPGKYQVVVAPPEPFYDEQAPAQPAIGRRMLPMKYQSYQTSGLESTVEAKENDITLTIDKAKR